MGKAIRTAAMVVGAVALTAVTMGAAATAMIPGFTATSVAGVSLSTWTAVAAGSSLVSMATGLAAGKPSVSGSPTKFMADPQAPIPYAIGRTRNSGNIIYQKTHTSPGKVPNDRLTMVVILSGGGPVQEIEAFYADGAPVTFNSAGAAIGDFANYMWQKTQLGQCPEPNALSVSSGDGTPPPGWTSAHKLSGYAAAIWTLRWDSKGEKYPNGVPEPAWIGKWARVYDPRLDSTYPGGSGPCRPLQEDTYVWSRNPYLHGLTWCLGRWQNGKRVLGIGVPLDGIDVAAFVEGANVADANAWYAGGVVYSTDAKWQILRNMLQAGGGEPIRLGAKISCVVNAPKVSLATVTANDIAGECRVAATQSRRDRINAAIPRYRSEAHNWEVVSGDKIIVAQHVEEDGGERTRELDMPLVQVEVGHSGNQPGQLARYAIENSREFGPITLTLKPRWVGYRPGDCITVNVSELGLVGQTVLILNRSLDPDTGVVTLTCRSETAAKHAFALGQTAVPPPTPGIASEPFPFLSWDLIPDPNGTKPEDNATVGGQFGKNIRDEFGNILSTDDIRQLMDKIGESQLLPELIKPINDGLVTSIIDIAHNDQQVLEGRLTQSAQQAELRTAAADLLVEARERIALEGKVEANAAAIIDVQEAIADEQEARATAISGLTATVNSHTAAIAEAQEAIADEQEARATAVSSLTASVNANAAAIASTQSALADETSARISQVNGLAVAVGGNTEAINATQAELMDYLIRSIIGVAHNDQQILTDRLSLALHRSEIQQAATDIAAEVVAREALAATVNGNLAALATQQSALATQTSAHASSITQLTARLNSAGGSGVTLEQALSTQADEIGTLSASYTVRINNNGKVTGFGLASGAGGTSEFAILADRFVVADPANNTTTAYPFQVIDGQVYIRKALIQKIQAGDIEVDSLAAITAKMGDLEIRPTAGMSGRIRIYDEDDNLRVVIGRMS